MDDDRQLLAVPVGDSAAPQPADAAARRRAWTLAALVIAALLALLLWLLRDAVAGAIRVWNESETYTHCYLIVPISAYLLWERRRELAATAPRPWPWALLLLPPLAVAWLVGDAASVLELEQIALISMAQVVLLAVLGWPVYRVAWFPFLYLYFLVPTGSWLVPALQDFTADFTVGALRLTGVPTYHDSIYINIPNGSFKVAEACAGLRFLIAAIAYGFLFAYMVYRSWRRRLVFVALSFVVPVIANGIRAYGIVILAYVTDNQVAVAADHVVYGWVFFSIVLLLLTWIGFWFREDDGEPAPAPGPAVAAARTGTPRRIALVGLLAAVGIVAGPAYADYLAAHAPAPAPALAAPPVQAPWLRAQAVAPSWQPLHPTADASLHETYVRGIDPVQLHVAFYARQRDGAEAVSSLNRPFDENAWRRAGGYAGRLEVDGESLRPAGLRLQRGEARLLVLHWYWVDGEYTPSMVTAKLLQVRSHLLQGVPAAAHILLAAPYRDGPEEARALIEDFLGHAEPLREAMGGGRQRTGD